MTKCFRYMHTLSTKVVPHSTHGMFCLVQTLKPVGGRLSGDKAKPVMLASKLPMDALGKVVISYHTNTSKH